jgi:isoleucyl-tRNA synthetase
MPYDASKNEQDVLKYWEEDDTFKKSVESRPADKPYVFYDGPPFATGLPHYGHIVGSVMKDAVPRYQTMKGYRVERVWGWDCHGLPIENIVEKELGTKSKKDIEEMGVEKFNELCRSKVLGYVEEWEKTIHRLGRWVDMKNAYRTMDTDYMESVWWVFKQLWDGGYVYKGHRSMHICPRCETTLSQQEVSEGYKDIKDLSATAQFKFTSDGLKEKINLKKDIYILAWTTTPWTLPGNVLLAVGSDVLYSVVACGESNYVVAKDLIMTIFEGKEFEVLAQVLGKDIVGETYEPLFPYYSDTENGFRVVAGDFVTTDEGTGVVHIAPGFGTDDFELSKEEGISMIQHVKMNGTFTEEVVDFAGMNVKPIEDHMATDVEIIKWLAHNGKLFAKKKYEHSYPHCWRCDTPLLNYATDSWFVAVTKVKEKAIGLAKDINWSPTHIKKGRFGKWLEGARDWSVSRQRFWASVIPVWESEDGDQICIGSVTELEELSGQKVDDLHKHIVDKVTFEKDGKKYTRVPDVLDTWFDSGSMPYAQVHYPYENQEAFDAGFPAEYIAEGQDQTRAWFYYLHIISSAIKGVPAFKNVIVNGNVAAEDGKKMSKKLQNYPDPNKLLETYGADALRYYLLTSPVMQAENLNFAEEGVREVYNKVVNTLANVLSFYEMFSEDRETPPAPTPASSESTSPKRGGDFLDFDHVLDRWILTRLQQLIKEVTEGMDAYNLVEASRPIMDFILDLSQWYVRSSRARFKGSDEEDKEHAIATLQHVLLTLSKVMAPFTPFVAEKVFYAVSGQATSVHLEDWPAFAKATADKPDSVLTDMELVRKVVETGHALRKEAGIPVRQVLAGLQIPECRLKDEQYLSLIAAELNVKIVDDQMQTHYKDLVEKEIDGIPEFIVVLNTEITDDLKKEGLLREVVRAVNQMRKEQGLTRHDRVILSYKTDDELLKSVFTDFVEELKVSVLADEVKEGGGTKIEIDGRTAQLSLS